MSCLCKVRGEVRGFPRNTMFLLPIVVCQSTLEETSAFPKLQCYTIHINCTNGKGLWFKNNGWMSNLKSWDQPKKWISKPRLPILLGWMNGCPPKLLTLYIRHETHHSLKEGYYPYDNQVARKTIFLVTFYFVIWLGHKARTTHPLGFTTLPTPRHHSLKEGYYPLW